MTGWQILVAETVTGKVINQRLPFTSHAWGDELPFGGDSQLSVVLPLEDEEQRNRAKAVASGKWRTTLIAACGTQAIVAGPVLTHSVGAGGGEVTIACGGPKALLKKRRVMDPDYYDEPENPAASVNLGPMSLRGIALTLLEQAIDGPGRGLPIELPTLTAGEYIGDAVRDYPHGEPVTVFDALQKIVESEGGPDIHIKPVISGDRRTFFWVVRLGNPYLTQESARPRVWPTGTDSGTISETGSAVDMANRWYVPGQATQPSTVETTGEQDIEADKYTPIGFAEDLGDIGVGVPILEAIERANQQDQSDQNTEALSMQAEDLLRVHGRPTVERPVTMSAENGTALGEYDLGDLGFVRVTKHGWIDQGDQPVQRVLGYSGDTSLDYTLTLTDPAGADD